MDLHVYTKCIKMEPVVLVLLLFYWNAIARKQ